VLARVAARILTLCACVSLNWQLGPPRGRSSSTPINRSTI